MTEKDEMIAVADLTPELRFHITTGPKGYPSHLPRARLRHLESLEKHRKSVQFRSVLWKSLIFCFPVAWGIEKLVNGTRWAATPEPVFGVSFALFAGLFGIAVALMVNHYLEARRRRSLRR